MTDERFDELLESMRDEHNQPGETPRDLMWGRIESARAAQETTVQASTSIFQRRRVWWPLAAAALLTLGIGLGRMSSENAVPNTAISTELVEAPEIENNNGIYTIVATRHLDRAEALLTHFEAGHNPRIAREQLATWSRDLLSDTRMLLDTPAIDEPTVRELLDDVEILLALILQISAADDDTAGEIVTESLRTNGVLNRLRSRQPANSV
jgi:hypothetical protein